MELSFSQCKQLADNYYGDLRDIVDTLNDQPEWITDKLDISDIQAIQHGGCASGAYMPAVTYYQAAETMAKHGDEILDFIESVNGLDLPAIPRLTSWSAIAVLYLSAAVELWCGQFDLDNVNWD